jgi:ribosome-binding protein aMBF1 (putative translation factor)
MGARVPHSFAYRRLRHFLLEWRENAGMTQRDLGKKLKKPHTYVHKCEVGDRRIDPLELIAWCRACGISPSRAIMRIELRP